MSTELTGGNQTAQGADGQQMSVQLTASIHEARRQVEICNACRFCEGYCAVFPAITRQRAFASADITQLANLCHNCRGCYYACQYTEPHEFDLNIPHALARVRQDSWHEFAFPRVLGNAFHRSGVALALVTIVCFSALFLLARAVGQNDADNFYAVMSHTMMVAIFLPAFLLPMISMTISLRRELCRCQQDHPTYDR